MREAFEQAIREGPDDLASHAACADWLQEQGDPRGEFIRVQLALEDGGRPTSAGSSMPARSGCSSSTSVPGWAGWPRTCSTGAGRRCPPAPGCAAVSTAGSAAS